MGHWTDRSARTGCTVVLPPPGGVAAGEIRGGAPAEREFALLSPERSVQRIDAVLLTGGSAYGLAACDGVVHWCAEQGIGLETPGGQVPIVVGLALYDLLVAEPGARPGADAGYAACEAASTAPPETGAVGAAAGATVGTWRGFHERRPGGVGSAAERHGDLVAGALVVVNAFGDAVGALGRRPPFEPATEIWAARGVPGPGPHQNTTLAVVATNAHADKLGCLQMAQAAHDGCARAIEPSHTTFDGDAAVALATGEVEAPTGIVAALAARAVEAAIHQAFD